MCPVLKYMDGVVVSDFEAESNWRALRKAAMETMNAKAVELHKPIQSAEAVQLLHDLLVDPQVRLYDPRFHLFGI